MHTIRLRHPWQCEPREQGSLWSRKFNWPAGLTEDETAWLVIEADGEVAPQLNEQSLHGNAHARFDVSTILREHNLLTLSHPAPPPVDVRECPFEVRLEIFSDDE